MYLKFDNSLSSIYNDENEIHFLSGYMKIFISLYTTIICMYVYIYIYIFKNVFMISLFWV